MIYREYGNKGIKLSVLGLGGHEFYSDGRIRGFADDYQLAVTPGYIFPGFGEKNRESIVKKALEMGINFFDLTIDSEKEAMGRILKKLKPSEEIYIQTRPEGMVYTYDENNKKMADYGLLKNEVTRILKLIGRERIDILNFAFMRSALESDSEYMDKIGYNISSLKKEGLIRFANADTFSGEEIYLTQIQSGHFDSIFIDFNIIDKYVKNRIMPACNERSIAIDCRVLFKKGRVFTLAEEAGITDKNLVARTIIKWVLSHNVTSAIIGVSSVDQLMNNVNIVENINMTEEEKNVIAILEKAVSE